jgi:tryptophan 2,3-dioxygenase
MKIDQPIIDILILLEEKYGKSGQDMKSYLEGLLHADYINYWDYIQVETLLTLQKPRTPVKDEIIFIIYHQITELYFKLCLHEIEQIADLKEYITPAFFTNRLKRMNAYFRNLTQSFEIMVNGMDREQFLQFRMSLLPASGFQSAQYRMVEICATDLINLVDKDKKKQFTSDSSVEEMFEEIYWKYGATDISTGKQTLTLSQFIEKYAKDFIHLAKTHKETNIWQIYISLAEDKKKDEALIAELKLFDEYVNVYWPLMHYKSAVRYLHKPEQDIAATGGTNWQKYLPPRFQRRIFFPQLWNDTEIDEWGKKGLFAE